MIKRFIYIVDYTLTQLNYERFGIDLLLKEGYEVEVVDAFDIQYSYKYRNILLPQTSSKEIKITQVSTYSDINKILNSYSDGDCVILMYEVGCIFNRITKTLNRKKIPVVCISTGSLPSLNFAKKTTYIGKIIKAFKMYSVIFIFNLFLQKTLEKISFTLLRPRIQYFIYGGTFAFINSNKILKQSDNVISAHTLDYDIFLQEELKPAKKYDKLDNKIDKYIVFVDQNFLDDPDRYLLHNSNAVIDTIRKEYYKKTGIFFDYLEDKFPYKVVIAAHPRSDIRLLSKNYKNRRVVINNTANLIKGCEFCLVHSSTAINFAVLYQKPVVIFKMKLFAHIMSKYQDTISDAIANLINANIVQIDSNNYNVVPPLVDEKAYSKYKKMFIKENSNDNKMFWKILEESINN